MKITKQAPVAVILVAVLSACGGLDKATPTAPSGPSSPAATVPPSPPTGGPGSGTIVVRELSPAPGAMLVVRSDCPPVAPGSLLRKCTDEWHGTFDVTLDREMTNAVLNVRFYDGQTTCGYGVGGLDIVPAGTRVSIRVARVFVSDEWLTQPCRLPATTNRIEVELWSDHGNWINTLVQEFTSSYTFLSRDS